MSDYGLPNKILDSIIDIGKQYGVERITLFGSRARGDYRERSDIDLAVYGGKTEEFSIDIEEFVPTLLKFDVVDMDKPVQEELVESINREGVVIYEKYGNFCRAYKNLTEAIKLEPPYDTVILTGLVGLFEITFEQSWKLMKDLLENYGHSGSATGSPRTIIKTAYQAGMINDSEAWLKALSARNNVTHSYNENIALNIVRETKEIYIKMFEELKSNIENNWCE